MPTLADAGWSRDRALALMHEYTASEPLRRHMYAVEIAMRAMAERAGASTPERLTASTLEKAAMQVEYISRIGFTTRWAT